jgi:hypothetical protein
MKQASKILELGHSTQAVSSLRCAPLSDIVAAPPRSLIFISTSFICLPQYTVTEKAISRWDPANRTPASPATLCFVILRDTNFLRRQIIQWTSNGAQSSWRSFQ